MRAGWGCPKGATGFHKGAIGLPPPLAPCIQLRLDNCLHLHSSPKSFPQPFPSWRSRCQTLKSKASSCFHYFMALWALNSCCFPFSSPPPPGKERPSPLDWAPTCVLVCRSLYFLCVMGTRDQPASVGAWPGLLGARCLLLDFGASLTLLAARDPFMALSTVNLSALQDAFTSFFICSSF